MKTKFLFLALVSLLLTACSQNESVEMNDEHQTQNSLRASLDNPLITFSWNTESRFMTDGKYEKAVAMNLQKAAFIDWGDGTGDLFTELNPEAYGYCFYHHYASGGNYTVKIYGEADAIVQFNNSNTWSGDPHRDYTMSRIDLSNCRSLKYLYLNRTADATGTLDLRANNNLERIYCSENNYTMLFVNGNKLQVLCCQKNRFPYLELIGCTRLRLLDTRYSPECEALYLLRGVAATVLKDDHTILEYLL
ncbi:MAG TPA: hypothetical protein DIT04_10935 [Dysgonomonas sp.]|nr:hypothetical protein [Dysgonomonas sp.]